MFILISLTFDCRLWYLVISEHTVDISSETLMETHEITGVFSKGEKQDFISDLLLYETNTLQGQSS